MLKCFFKDSFVYSLTLMLSGSLSLLLLPFLTRHVTPEEYGLLELFLSLYAIINIILPLEITQAIARFYPTLPLSERYKYASSALWFTLMMYVVFILLIWWCQPILIGLNIIVENEVQIFKYAMVSTLCFGLYNYMQMQLRWLLKPVAFLVSNAIFITISVCMTIILIHYFSMNVEGFFLARSIAAITAGLACWCFSKNVYRFVFNLNAFKIMISFSYPLVISSLGVIICLYIDRFMIRALLSPIDLGIYSVAARLASIAGSVFTVLNYSLTPLIYSHYQDAKTPQQIAFLFKMIVYLMLFSLLLLLLFAKQILQTIAGDIYGGGEYVLCLLSFSFMLAGLVNLAPGLWIANKTKLIAFINILSGCVNSILCLILIPYFGMNGAAMATMLATSASWIVTIRYAQKYYFITYDWTKINSAIAITLFFAYLTVIRS